MTSIISCLSVFAQNTTNEKSFISTDRDFYIAGEHLYFKYYSMDTKTKKESNLSKVAYLVLRSETSNQVVKGRFNLEKGRFNGKIVLSDTLSSGLYQILAFTQFMKNDGEYYFAKKTITITNRYDKKYNFKRNKYLSTDDKIEDSTIQIITNKTIYSPRENVKIRIDGLERISNPSLSVYESTDYLALYDSTESKTMPTSAYFTPERKGKILNGQLINLLDNKPENQAIVLLSTLDTIPNLQYAVTDKNGNFQFLLNDYYNNKILFLKLKDHADELNLKFIMKNEFEIPEKWSVNKYNDLVSDNNDLKKFLIKSQNIFYINKIYPQKNQHIAPIFLTNNTTIPRFYHRRVISKSTADYMSLPDFKEIVVELLPEVRLIKNENKYEPIIFNSIIRQNLTRKPAIFIDGIYNEDINNILTWGSDKIRKIDIIDNDRALGDLIFGGMISINSSKNDFLDLNQKNNTCIIENDDIIEQFQDKHFDFSGYSNEKMPVLKQLLYWNPNLPRNNEYEFEFKTSDNTGKFVIKFNGIDQAGNQICKKVIFHVNN